MGHLMVSHASRRKLISVVLVDLVWLFSSTVASTPVGKIKELDFARRMPLRGGFSVLPYKREVEWSLEDRLMDPSVGGISRGGISSGVSTWPSSMSEF
jgi:hypothetical protein